MKMVNFLRLSLFLFLGAALFQSCSKDPIFDPAEEELSEAFLIETDQTYTELEDIDLTDFGASAATRNPNSCNILVCVTFTGTGRYAADLPNGTTVFVNLNAQTVTVNGISFPLINNQLCQTLTVPGSSTATLRFKGSGSAVVTATINGTTTTVFSAGVGNPNVVLVNQDVTLTCPPHNSTDCEVELCVNFTGTGRYRLSLPNGTTVFANLNAQTVTINGTTFPLVNNQLCQLLPFSGPVTADVGFKGSGSAVITGTWPDGTVCTVFSAGVGNPNVVLVRQDVTLSCDPPC